MGFIIGNELIKWSTSGHKTLIPVSYNTDNAIAYIDLKRIPKHQPQNILAPHTLAQVAASLKAGYLTVIVDYGITQNKLAADLLSENSQRIICERAGIDFKDLKIKRIDLERPNGIHTIVIFDQSGQGHNDLSSYSQAVSKYKMGPGNISKKEILLEGFGDCGQWNDEFEKALSLLDQGKCVVLKKENSEEPIIIELKKGENESEVLLDLLGNSEMQCSDILPSLLNYILNEGRSVAVDYGDIGTDAMEEDLKDPCSSYNSTLLGVTFYIELRDFGNKHHYILLLKSDSED